MQIDFSRLAGYARRLVFFPFLDSQTNALADTGMENADGGARIDQGFKFPARWRVLSWV
jgi:hypothetical protein